MAINKIKDRLGNTIIDLSTDTVNENKVLAGETFHGPDGEIHTGKLQGPPVDGLDLSKYNFIDYDGTVMYEYTDDELDALEELPAGPDHTDENLTFQEWNWDLASLKAFNRTRPDRPIVGPSLITSDEKTYIGIKTSPSLKETISIGALRWNNVKVDIDWGDGTVETVTTTNSTSRTHTYAAAGEYVITITPIEYAEFLKIAGTSSSLDILSNGRRITFIKLGKLAYIGDYCKLSYCTLSKINIPKSVQFIEYYSMKNASFKTIILPNNLKYASSTAFGFLDLPLLETVSFPASMSDFATNSVSVNFGNCFSVKNVVLPDDFNSYFAFSSGGSSVSSISFPDNYTKGFTLQDCRLLKSVRLAESISNIPSNSFSGCQSLSYLEIPEGCTALYGAAFQNNYSLKSITIPDSVTSIGSNCFSGCYVLTLDLSKQTKVITLTGAIGLNTKYNQILVPIALLDQYKNASYWSNYATAMVGV